MTSSIIYFVTTNARKAATYTKRFKEIGYRVEIVPIEIEESRDFDVRDVARKKAQAAARATDKRPLIVEDRGLKIRSLNDFPGSHVKVATGLLGLAKLIGIIDPKNPTVRFDYAVVLIDVDEVVHEYYGYEDGTFRIPDNGDASDLLDIFCSDRFPDTPVACLNDAQRELYEQHWHATDALHYLINDLVDHD